MSNFEPDDNMLNNYIQNKLNEVDTMQLELWLVDHPEMMQDIELGLMFAQAKEAYKQKSKSFSLLNFFTHRKFIPLHALVYLLLGFFTFNMYQKAPYSTNSSAIFIELEKQRGLDTSITKIRAEQNKSLVIRLFPDSLTEKYSLIMHAKTDNHLLEFNNLQADDYGSITVTLMNVELIQGEWKLVLKTHEAGEEQSYLISIGQH